MRKRRERENYTGDSAEERQNYRWYTIGCERFGWEPLSRDEFLKLYHRYKRCGRTIQKYERRQTLLQAKGKSLGGIADKFMERLLTGVRRERDKLDYLANAVAAGQRYDELDEGGAGVTANLRPEPPVLVGAAAKELPTFEGDRDWMTEALAQQVAERYARYRDSDYERSYR